MSTTVNVSSKHTTINVHEISSLPMIPQFAVKLAIPETLKSAVPELQGKPVVECSSHIVWINAPMAREMLKRNVCNRKIRKDVVRQFDKAMKNGTYVLGAAPIIFDTLWRLVDSQHRLMAVEMQPDDKYFPFLVLFGFPVENLHTLDNGTKRTIADHMKLRGYKDFTTRITNILVSFYNDPGINRFKLDFADSMYAKHHDLCDWVQSFDHPVKKVLSPNVVGLLMRANLLGYNKSLLERFAKLCDLSYYEIESTNKVDNPVMKFYSEWQKKSKQGKQRFNIRKECAEVLLRFLFESTGKKITSIKDAEKAFEMPWDKDFVKKEKGAKKTK